MSLPRHLGPLALQRYIWIYINIYGVAATPEEEPSKLVVVLQGAITDTQIDQKMQQAAEEVPQEQPGPPQIEQAATPPPPDETPPEMPEAEQELPPPAAQATSAAAEISPKAVADVQREAQRIDDRQDEMNRLREYVKDLGKKIQDSLPDEDRRATVIVSFVILSDGQLRAETVRVVKSSGVARLDATALETIRGSSPFAPPPREMTITIDVAFDRKK